MWQVLETLVTKSPGETKLGDGWSLSPADADRQAKVMTRRVADRKFVGEQIKEELDDFGLSVHWLAGDWFLKVEVSKAAETQSIRKLVRRIDKIVETHKNSTFPTDVPFARASM